MSSKPAAASKPSTTVVHKSRGDEAENRRKKPKKKTSSTSERVLNPRNDATTKTTESSSSSLQFNKRKSEQISKWNSSGVEPEDDSGCPKPKKPSPKHNVSIQYTHVRALRSSASKLLQVARTNHSGSCCFSIANPMVWNSLPHSVLFCESLTTFWKHLKTFYFQSAFPGTP